MILVPFAEWPESEVMIKCEHSEATEIPDAYICLKRSACTCLERDSVSPQDELDKEKESDEQT
jgi:hypothetical protein